MFNVKAIRERIADILNEAAALSALVEGEDRPFDDKEQAEFDGYLASIGNDGSDGEAVTGLYADLARAKKLEAIKADMAAPLNHVPAPVRSDGGPPTIKAKRRQRRNLKAYSGFEEEGYRAGRWAAAALFGDDKSRQWCSENGLSIQAAQTEGNNSKGGFLVPDELAEAIIDLRESYGVFRRWGYSKRMGSDHQNIPRRKSGLTAYAVGEGDEITSSDKEWNNVELTAKKWGVLVKYSTELGEDAFIDMADDLAGEMAYAFALKEDQSGFIGDGTSTYHGVTGLMVKVSDGNHAASEHVAISGNTSFGELDMADFETALGLLPEYAAEANPAWFISRVGYYASMVRLKNAAGGNNNDDIGAGSGMEFLGLPVVVSQVLNSTTTAQVDTNLCAVGDLGLASTIGDRRNFTLSTSGDRYFENDQWAIKGTVRTAINVHDLGDGTTAGPMVVIRTPGS